MADDPLNRPASREEVVEALQFALRFDGRRAFAQSASLMARITAEHLAEHLERCGLAVVRRPNPAAPSATDHLPEKPPEDV